jgi:hypothetical protein
VAAIERGNRGIYKGYGNDSCILGPFAYPCERSSLGSRELAFKLSRWHSSGQPVRALHGTRDAYHANAHAGGG